MNNRIHPCLWFDGNGKEAADFYTGIFENSRITIDTPMVVMFEIEGKKIMALNGGPTYKLNPSISFYVSCESVEEIDEYYNKLIDGGMAMMALDKYPWSERYGWVADKFGTTWQLILHPEHALNQKISSAFLFTGSMFGHAAEAMKKYTSIFPNSKILAENLYPDGDPQIAGKLMFGQFSIDNEVFVAMDGPGEHKFQFNEAYSLVVECDDQDELDKYWTKLTEGGEEVQCGWLKDEFGVAWQILPKILPSLLTDPEKSKRVMVEVQKQIKLDIQKLVDAAWG